MYVDGDDGGEEVEDPFPQFARLAPTFLLQSKKSNLDSEREEHRVAQHDVVLIDLV